MTQILLIFFQSTPSIESLSVSLAALIVAIVSFYFSLRNWRETNRPLITARITSFNSAGNVGTPLSIVVENTGNRPAKTILLNVSGEDLDHFLIAKKGDPLRKQVELCFSDIGMIPVLANGKSISNSFGFLSEDEKCTWKAQSRFDLHITYKDLDGRRFKHNIPIKIADDTGFAAGFWSSSS